MATRKVGRSWPTKLLRFVPSGGGRWPEPIKLPTSRAASRSKTRHLGWRLGITVLDRPFCRRSLSVSLGDPQHRRSRRHRREDKTLSSLGDVQLAAAGALSPNPVRVCEVDAWSAGDNELVAPTPGHRRDLARLHTRIAALQISFLVWPKDSKCRVLLTWRASIVHSSLVCRSTGRPVPDQVLDNAVHQWSAHRIAVAVASGSAPEPSDV